VSPQGGLAISFQGLAFLCEAYDLLVDQSPVFRTGIEFLHGLDCAVEVEEGLVRFDHVQSRMAPALGAGSIRHLLETDQRVFVFVLYLVDGADFQVDEVRQVPLTPSASSLRSSSKAWLKSSILKWVFARRY